MNRLFIIVMGILLALTGITEAAEYSFGDWAIDNGLAGDAIEAAASGGGITNLAGLDDYPDLETLWLDNNQLMAISVADLASMTKIKNLYLHQNQISSIEPGSFAASPNLHILWLGENQLTTVTYGLFSDLGNLRTLKLPANQITSIAPDSFIGSTDIQELWLGDNNLTEITAGTFVGLSNLETLKLLANPITDLDLSKVYFNALTSFMAGNTDIIRANFRGAVLSQSAFAALIDGLAEISTINELTLADANLVAVDMPGSLSQMDNVIKLDLSGIIWNASVMANDYDYIVNIINNLEQDALDELTIDVFLYNAREDFFQSWAAKAGNTLIVNGCIYDLPGDVNDDCVCNLEDFAIMAANWLIDCNSTPDDPTCVLK